MHLFYAGTYRRAFAVASILVCVACWTTGKLLVRLPTVSARASKVNSMAVRLVGDSMATCSDCSQSQPIVSHTDIFPIHADHPDQLIHLIFHHRVSWFPATQAIPTDSTAPIATQRSPRHRNAS